MVEIYGDLPEGVISIQQVASFLGITPTTITRWYNWYKSNKANLPETCPGLPPYYKTSAKSTRYFKTEDIEQIERFQYWIPKGRKGLMASENYKYQKKD